MTLLPYILIVGIALFGGIATMIIGNSKANQTSNPEYDRRTKQNLSKLTYVYVGAIVLGIGGFRPVFIQLNNLTLRKVHV